MTDLRKAAEAVLERWDSPAWEWKKQGPTADLMANLRTALAAEQPKPEPVAAQHRFRLALPATHWARKIGSPDWGPWHTCKVSNRPAREIDSVGWEVEYRNLYAAPPEDDALRRDAERWRWHRADIAKHMGRSPESIDAAIDAAMRREDV